MENATDKQIELMKKLGIYQPNLSAKEAWDACNAKIQEINADKSNKIEREPSIPGKVVSTHVEKPKSNGFHLTVEQCRSNALASAIELLKGPESDDLRKENTLMNWAKDFEKYIRFGE